MSSLGWEGVFLYEKYLTYAFLVGPCSLPWVAWAEDFTTLGNFGLGVPCQGWLGRDPYFPTSGNSVLPGQLEKT